METAAYAAVWLERVSFVLGRWTGSAETAAPGVKKNLPAKQEFFAALPNPISGIDSGKRSAMGVGSPAMVRKKGQKTVPDDVYKERGE